MLDGFVLSPFYDIGAPNLGILRLYYNCGRDTYL